MKKILKSKLNSGDVLKAINSRALVKLRYGAWLIKWTKNELITIDRKARKKWQCTKHSTLKLMLIASTYPG